MRFSGRISSLGIIGAAAIAWTAAAPGLAQATVFQLTASDIVIEQPAPLFTSPSITGTLTLDDAILPGQSFGSPDVTAITLDFEGVTGDLADVQADIAPGPVQLFGTRSADGSSFSVLDFRFGFPSTVAGCGFFCAGQIIINSPLGPNDPSNFFASNDIFDPNISVIDSFTPRFVALGSAVPEPSTWTFLLLGSGGLGAALRRRDRKRLAA